MKKYLLYLLIIPMFFTSCKENETEYLFDDSINNRTEAIKQEYNSALTTPENGWIGYYAPNGDVGTNILLLNFDNEGNVVMKSDWNNGADDGTITYRIDKTLKMELVFETRSVLHAIYEENDNDNGGEYVFNILSATADKVVLESKNDNGYNDEEITILELLPASAADWDLSAVQEMHENLAGDELAPVWRNITVAGDPFATFSYNGNTKVATLSYVENGVFESLTVPVSVTSTGFCFLQDVTIGNTTLQCFTWNATTNIFEDLDNNAELAYSQIPLFPLNPYDFGNEAGNIRMMRSNSSTISLDQSSTPFANFYDGWTDDFAAAIGSDFAISRFYVRDIDKSVAYIHIYLASGHTAWYDCTTEITETSVGKIVKFIPTGDKSDLGVGAFFAPMVDFIFRDSGFYMQKMTPLSSSQNTIGLVPVDDPTMLVHWYDF